MILFNKYSVQNLCNGMSFERRLFYFESYWLTNKASIYEDGASPAFFDTTGTWSTVINLDQSEISKQTVPAAPAMFKIVPLDRWPEIIGSEQTIIIATIYDNSASGSHPSPWWHTSSSSPTLHQYHSVPSVLSSVLSAVPSSVSSVPSAVPSSVPSVPSSVPSVPSAVPAASSAVPDAPSSALQQCLYLSCPLDLSV